MFHNLKGQLFSMLFMNHENLAVLMKQDENSSEQIVVNIPKFTTSEQIC